MDCNLENLKGEVADEVARLHLKQTYIAHLIDISVHFSELPFYALHNAEP